VPMERSDQVPTANSSRDGEFALQKAKLRLSHESGAMGNDQRMCARVASCSWRQARRPRHDWAEMMLRQRSCEHHIKTACDEHQLECDSIHH